MSIWGRLTGRPSKSHSQNALDVTQVRDRQSFLKFIAALEVDLSSNSATWENPDLPRFLRAMARWVDDTKRQNHPNPWRHAAELLMAARIYE